MSNGRPEHPTVAVVVLAAGREATLERCLESLAMQKLPAQFAVVVVDTAPSRGAADHALRLPGVHWVVLTSQAGLAALCRCGMDAARFDRLALIDAAYQPDPDWLARGLALLDDGADLATSSLGNGFVDMFVASHVPARIRFEGNAGDDQADLEAFLLRCGWGGLKVSRGDRPSAQPIALPFSGRTAPEDLSLPTAGRPPFDVGVRHPAHAQAEEGLISVVICSGGYRPDQLQRCLASITKLTDSNFEILLVDNAPSPAVKLDQLPAGVKHVHEPRRGLDRARNRGIRESAGDIIAFVDDDCEVHPDWLIGIRESFSDPFVSFVTGRVRPAGLHEEPQQWFEEHFSFDRGPSSGRFTRFDFGGRSPLRMGDAGTGANMAFRRELLESVGGFDENLDMGTLIGGGGDLDILGRALEEGAVGHYAADAVVFHHHRDSLTRLRWQTWGYGLSQGAVCAKWLIARRGRRLHAAARYLRLLHDHRARLAAIRIGVDGYPADLARLEFLGIAVGPLVYIASVVHQACIRPR